MRNSSDYAVRDPARLARVMRTLVDHYGGSQSAAAKRLGLSQSYVNKLLHGRPASLGLETYGALDHAARKVPGGLVYELQDAFISAEAESVHLAHTTALRAEIRRAGVNLEWLPPWVDGWAAPPVLGAGGRGSRHELFIRVANELWRRMPRLFRAFERWFEVQFGGSEGEGERWVLAVIRLCAPFVLAEESGIERPLDALSREELRHYFDHAVAAEKVLLSRDSAFALARYHTGDNAAGRRKTVSPRRRRLRLA